MLVGRKNPNNLDVERMEEVLKCSLTRTDLSSSAAAAAAARIHLPPLAAADAAAADEVLLGEEGDGGEERRAAEGQQDGVHDAASRLGSEHSSSEVQVVVTPDSLDIQKLLLKFT